MTHAGSDAAVTPVATVVLTRTFDAPRPLVFRAWTEPEHLAQWWGPHGFTNPVCEADARPGGALLIHMAFPDGVTVSPMSGTFIEVTPFERIVLSTEAYFGGGQPLDRGVDHRDLHGGGR